MKKLNNIIMFVIYDIINSCMCKCDYYDLSQFTDNNKKNKKGCKYEHIIQWMVVYYCVSCLSSLLYDYNKQRQ